MIKLVIMIEEKKRTITPEIWEKIRKDFKTGLYTWVQLSEKYNYDKSNIRRKALKDGWTLPEKEISSIKVAYKKKKIISYPIGDELSKVVDSYAKNNVDYRDYTEELIAKLYMQCLETASTILEKICAFVDTSDEPFYTQKDDFGNSRIRVSEFIKDISPLMVSLRDVVLPPKLASINIQNNVSGAEESPVRIYLPENNRDVHNIQEFTKPQS